MLTMTVVATAVLMASLWLAEKIIVAVILLLLWGWLEHVTATIRHRVRSAWARTVHPLQRRYAMWMLRRQFLAGATP